MLKLVGFSVLLSLPLVAAVACGGSTVSIELADGSTDADPDDDDAQPDSSTEPDGAIDPDSTTAPRVPKNHRPTATPCDDTRDSTPPHLPEDTDVDWVRCTKHEDCTEGVNGRCTGNGHDGWQCSYDRCSSDADCGEGVCQCGGGFRTDANVCLSVGCKVDADCGPNRYCSPSQGSCGAYSGIVTYACHEDTDECIDDEDCASQGGGSCRYEAEVGHWKCSTSECAG